MGKRLRWTKERIIEEIRRLDEQGVPLYMASVRRVFSPLVATACSRKYFGSWRAAIEAAGFNYDKIVRVKRWTKERVLDQIRKLKEEGIDLRPKSVEGDYPGLLVAAREHFGSWGDAVKAAGIDYDTYVKEARRREIEEEKRRIIEEIRRLYEEGRVQELSGAWRYHLSLFRKARHRFGNWRKAIEAAGLDYEAIVKRRKWTKERIIEEIRRLHEMGKDLSVTAMQKEYPALLSIAQSPLYFGSWRAAVEAAGIDYEMVKRQRGPRRKRTMEARVAQEDG